MSCSTNTSRARPLSSLRRLSLWWCISLVTMRGLKDTKEDPTQEPCLRSFKETPSRPYWLSVKLFPRIQLSLVYSYNHWTNAWEPLSNSKASLSLWLSSRRSLIRSPKTLCQWAAELSRQYRDLISASQQRFQAWSLLTQWWQRSLMLKTRSIKSCQRCSRLTLPVFLSLRHKNHLHLARTKFSCKDSNLLLHSREFSHSFIAPLFNRSSSIRRPSPFCSKWFTWPRSLKRWG